MIKTRKITKTRQSEKSRGITRTRKKGKEIVDFIAWATINRHADGVTLSYLVNDNSLDLDDKNILLDGVLQEKGYTKKLRGTWYYIYHTELSLTKGVEHIITFADNTTKTIKLPIDTFNIAYISDIHYLDNPQTSTEMFEVVAQANVDYILCGGDWVIDDVPRSYPNSWVEFINDCLAKVNDDKITPFLIPTIGNHDHVGVGRPGEHDNVTAYSPWYGYEKDVHYLHDVFPFDNGMSETGYGLIDLTDDVSVFVTDFCTSDILGNQIEWFENEAKKRTNKKNIFVSHVQLFPSDRPARITDFLRDNYFQMVHDYFQFGLDGHDHSLTTIKPIISVDNEETGEGGIRFFGQGGMSDKWYNGSQADAWYMDEIVLRKNHFHNIYFNGTEFEIKAIDENGDVLSTHIIDRDID